MGVPAPLRIRFFFSEDAALMQASQQQRSLGLKLDFGRRRHPALPWGTFLNRFQKSKAVRGSDAQAEAVGLDGGQSITVTTWTESGESDRGIRPGGALGHALLPSAACRETLVRWT